MTAHWRSATVLPSEKGCLKILFATLLGLLNLAVYGGEPKWQICATNVAFGDPDSKSLYVTACDDAYRIRLKVAGVMPGPRR